MSEPDKTWTRIRIEAPLPMGVAGALMQMIGMAWPEAVIVPNKQQGFGRDYALCMEIPPKGARTISRTSAEGLADEGGSDPATEVDFLGFNIDEESHAWISFAPPEELCLFLGEIGKRLLEVHDGAVNYLEWQIRTKDGEEYVLSVARSKGQTPGALRTKAEAEVERLKALLEAHGIES